MLLIFCLLTVDGVFIVFCILFYFVMDVFVLCVVYKIVEVL